MIIFTLVFVKYHFFNVAWYCYFYKVIDKSTIRARVNIVMLIILYVIYMKQIYIKKILSHNSKSTFSRALTSQSPLITALYCKITLSSVLDSESILA